MKPEELVCQSCGCVDSPNKMERTFSNGTNHIEARCRHCGSFIKFMPNGKPIDVNSPMPFGKHKGEMIATLPSTDMAYVRWASENLTGKWREVFKTLAK